MSTKINARSPFYLSYSEPTEPSVELTCALINLNNMSVDQFGNVTLPNAVYGNILSYTSTDSDFTDGRFATVSTATSRTISFTISIPPSFSNAGDDTIICSATAIQPIFTCSGGVTTNGSIPNQSLNTNGDTVTIDLSSYFTQGVLPILRYNVTNNYPDVFSYILDGNDLTIVANRKAGTQNLYVEASDGDSLTCNATQSIQITTTAQESYDCTDAYIVDGSIAQDGTITDPTVNGVIASKSLTSGGAHITSVPANTSGSAQNITLYFDITVPTGYSNTGAEVICSKTFSQPSASLPLFDCSVAGLSGQAITQTGTINVGVSRVGFITDFSPLKFDSVTSSTSRTVDYTVTAPSTGYSNSGDTITCSVTMIQPAPPAVLTCGNSFWYGSSSIRDFMTVAQVQAAYPLAQPTEWYNTARSFEAEFLRLGADNKAVLGDAANAEIKLNSDTMELNINTPVCIGHNINYNSVEVRRTQSGNPSGGFYKRVTKIKEFGYSAAYTPAELGESYYIKQEPSGMISEIWLVNWNNGTFTRIDNII
jgi:hypothetical protein